MQDKKDMRPICSQGTAKERVPLTNWGAMKSSKTQKRCTKGKRRDGSKEQEFGKLTIGKHRSRSGIVIIPRNAVHENKRNRGRGNNRPTRGCIRKNLRWKHLLPQVIHLHGDTKGKGAEGKGRAQYVAE